MKIMEIKLTSKFRHEESQTNAHRCDEGRFGLLRSQHEDSDDQITSQKHLDEQPLGDGRPRFQGRLHRSNIGWEHAGNQCCRNGCADELSRDEDQSTDRRQGTAEYCSDEIR